MSGRAARSNNGCLTNSRNCAWYVIMELKITPSGQTIVKPTALGPVANTDSKLLIYGLFQKGRVLAQDGIFENGRTSEPLNVPKKPVASSGRPARSSRAWQV